MITPGRKKGTTPGISRETPEAARAPLSLDKSGTLGLCARALLLEVIQNMNMCNTQRRPPTVSDIVLR